MKTFEQKVKDKRIELAKAFLVSSHLILGIYNYKVCKKDIKNLFKRWGWNYEPKITR